MRQHWLPALAVMVAILLAVWSRIYHFVRSVLSESELHDAVIFAARLVWSCCRSSPTVRMGAYDAINPWTIWKIVVLMMSVSAAGCFLRSVFLSPANQTIQRGKKKTQIEQVFDDL
jgi:uncharacterized membrane protein (DUF4010 family)